MNLKHASKEPPKPRRWDVTDPSAGPGHIYKSEHSPFAMKSGDLVEFRPRNAIRYIRDQSIHPFARQFLFDGLCAWVICPNRVLKTTHKNVPQLESSQFIQNAMLVAAACYLDSSFKMARAAQRQNNAWDASDLLSWPLWHRYPFELFLELGGINAVLRASSQEDFDKYVKNQKQPVQNVVAIMERLHAHAVQSTWGLNAATEALAKGGRHGKASKSSKSLLKSHWNNLKPSAPYLYAAKLVDDGRLLESFMDNSWRDVIDDEWRDQWLSTWLGYAAAIAETILKPRRLAGDWAKYQPPDAEPRPLPEILSDRSSELQSSN